MKNLRSLTLPLYACCVAAICWSCTGLQPIAGGTSETTNGFVAAVRSQSGTPVSRALVRLRPEDYLSDTSGAGVQYDRASVVDTFTDTLGVFRITGIDTGNYTIEIQDGMGGGALLRSSAYKDSIVDCGVAVVQQVGSISGFVDRAVVGDSVTVYVRVYGLERQMLADPAAGSFALNGVPAGVYTLSFIASSSAYASKELSASAPSGSAADIGRVALFPFSGWRYSMTVGLNTTSAGADVPGDVYDFPILVRLRDSNFIFNQAGTNGEDIRFAKSDSTPLPFEIERWNPAAGLAEVWVKIDTVHGDNNTQSIIMYWGNHGAASASNSAAVFDAAAGFQGVWHLGEAGNTTAFDATANSYDGTPTGMSTASAVSGIIGTAQNFNGVSSYITMANTANSMLSFPEDGSYSLSLWVYADTIDTLWHVIAGKGHEQYYVKLKCFGNNRATWEFVEFQDQQGWDYTEDSTPPAPGAKQWVNITGVREDSQQRLYINGTLVSSTIGLMAGNYTRNTGDDFTIGRYARLVTIPYYEGRCYFDGSVDEVRVSNVVSSADWIKLCYMNQRSDDKLVVFR
ncbi:MAG: DUF2341 domain-containing protein [Chitinispirillaceae bacterium]|nr:DUF2341 domain-containing protein [Chitinispirillaceae bacterium]